MILAFSAWFGFVVGLAATLVYAVLAVGSKRMADGTAQLCEKLELARGRRP